MRDAMPSTVLLEIEPPADETVDLRGKLRELEERLAREQGRSTGLARGLSALSERVTVLRDENARLRQRLTLAGLESD